MKPDDRASPDDNASSKFGAVSVDQPVAEPTEPGHAENAKDDLSEVVHSVPARRRVTNIGPTAEVSKGDRETVYAAAAAGLRRMVDEAYDRGRSVTAVHIEVEQKPGITARPIAAVIEHETRTAA